MLSGGCLCGGIRYALHAPIEGMDHCHCSMCRKAHGAAFATYGRVARSGHQLDDDEGLLERYRSSDAVTRSFCRRCGANLLFEHAAMPDAVVVPIGSLDGDPGLRPESHIFVGSKAVWYDLQDALPRHDAYPPGLAD